MLDETRRVLAEIDRKTGEAETVLNSAAGSLLGGEIKLV
jgi:hypothetical protein